MSFQFNKFLQHFIVILGLVLSIFIGYFTYEYYEKKESLQLEIQSNEIVQRVKSRMDTYEQVLKSGVALFAAVDNVNREKWSIFVKELKLNEKFKGIQGLGHSAVVFLKNKISFEEHMRDMGFPNFKIYPKGKREIYTPVIYLEPFNERNKRAFGYDVFSEKIRSEAIKKSIQSGKAVLTKKVQLVQEFGNDIQAGFLMYLPIYKKGFNLDTPENRTLAIEGLVSAPFRVNDLMQGILGSTLTNVDFEIYDGDFVSQDHLLYDSNTNQDFKKVYKITNININDHSWTITFKTSSILKNENIYIPLLFTSFTLILTLLLYLLLNSLIKNRENAVKIAQKTTKELQFSKERLNFALEGTGHGIWDWNLQTDEIFLSKRWKKLFGFTDNEISNTLDEWTSRVHPEDKEQVDIDLAAHIEGKKDFYSNEHRVKCKDGSYKWILDTGVIVSRDIEGKPLRMVGSKSDISQRKEIESRFEKTRLLLSHTINSVSNLIFVKDTKCNYIECNKAFEYIVGKPKKDILGKNDNDLFSKENADLFRKKDQEILSCTKTILNFEWGRYPDGRKVYLFVTKSPLFNDSNEVIGIVGNAIDLTEQNELKKELLIVNKKLLSLSENIPGVIYSFQLFSDGRTCFPFASDQIYAIYGVTAQEVQEDASKAFDNIHPEDLEHLHNTIQTSAQELALWEDEYRVVHPDKGNIWVKGIAKPEKQLDGSVLWHGYIYNITEKKAAEIGLQNAKDYYKSLLEYSSDGIHILDIKGNIIAYSRSFANHLGYEYDELKTLNVKDWDTKISQDQIETFLSTIKSRAILFETQHRKKDGSSVDVQINAKEIELGGISCIYASSRDITERKRIEKELALKEEMMLTQSKQAAMGEMIAMIAHQWRQPLTVMSMEVNSLSLSIALEEEISKEQLLELGNSLSTEIQQLSDTINDFRNFFKPDQVKEQVSIKDVLDATLKIIGTSLSNNNIELSIQNTSTSSVLISKSSLTQVLLNIIGNAKDALLDKKMIQASIDINVSETKDDISISICDNAGGIPDAIIDKLGQPYFTTKQNFNGTGLGLYISSTIMKKHMKGTLNWYNKGLGACFIVTLKKDEDI